MQRSTLRIWLVSTAALLALAANVSAGIIRHDVPDAAYLNLANDPRYQAVGMLSWSDSQYNYTGSGTVIESPDNRWILTAAHLLDTAAARTFNLGAETFNIIESIVHPKWDGSLATGYDIALARLDTTPSITPATRFQGDISAGTVGTFVGYGITGDGLTGATTFDALKRAGQNTIDVNYQTPGKGSRIFGVDFDNPQGSSNTFGGAALALEYLIASGDSGGGVFVDNGSGSFLAGIHSFGVDYNTNGLTSDYGDYTGHTYVAAFNDWIDSVLFPSNRGRRNYGRAIASANGSTPFDLAWDNIPEPGSALLLALGSISLLSIRRRRRIA